MQGPETHTAGENRLRVTLHLWTDRRLELLTESRDELEIGRSPPDLLNEDSYFFFLFLETVGGGVPGSMWDLNSPARDY